MSKPLQLGDLISIVDAMSAAQPDCIAIEKTTTPFGNTKHIVTLHKEKIGDSLETFMFDSHLRIEVELSCERLRRRFLVHFMHLEKAYIAGADRLIEIGKDHFSGKALEEWKKLF